MFEQSFQQFYRFAGHGNVPYGNGRAEGGFRDNGKHSGLAIGMAIAAMISPEGEQSVYANARDTAAMKAFYATNWFHAAHTGGGMGEIWHHGAVALMREKRPIPYRSYLDTRRWVMDSSRRHDGSIAIEGMDDRYNRSVTDAKGQRAWGTYFALTYTYPRKQLQIWGAPRSPYAKTSPLPQPWGNATDRIFQSPEPVDIGESVKKTFANIPSVLTDSGTGAVMKGGSKTIRSRMSSVVFEIPDGEPFMKRIPKTTLASFKSGNDSDMYAYDGKFVPKEAFVGDWKWAVYPSPAHSGEIDERINSWVEDRMDNPPLLKGRPKDKFSINADGTTSWSKFYRGKYFWTDGWLVGITDGQAVKMEVRTYHGYDFLIIEKGGFAERYDGDDLNDVPEDFHCGFFAYIRDTDI